MYFYKKTRSVLIMILALSTLLFQGSSYNTLQKTIVPGTPLAGKIGICDFASYDTYGYGTWTDGAGLPYDRRLDLMPAKFDVSALGAGTKLLNFFTISDIHITDKEAPNQLIYLQHLHPTNPIGISVASGIMMYTTQMFDAAIQTINDLHKQKPFDFGLSLGDETNSSTYIETRWYIDTLDGKLITPNSGAHLGARTVDYQKPFKAAGLNKEIPWYQVRGNHDHFWMGSLPTAGLARTYTTDKVLKFKDILNPSDKNYYYMGVFDGTNQVGRIIKVGPASEFSIPPMVAADPDRRALIGTQWMNEFSNTKSNPVGHGFKLVDPTSEAGFACYSFVPKSNLPLKVIVLDDTQSDDSDYADIHGRGYLDQARWNWLKQQLADGDRASQLMIIASHVPINVELSSSPVGWSAASAVTLKGLVAELQRHPNLIMWVAGHRHLNTVKAFISPDPNHPEKGFWEVETASLRDFPQQFRTFEISLNRDYSISIFTTDVDPTVRAGSLAAKSRQYAIGAVQILGSGMLNSVIHANPTKDPTIKEMPNGSYNGELLKKLSPSMEAIMRQRFPAGPSLASDPMPSWNKGPAKLAILNFVAGITKPNGPDYVAPADRIAVFDTDGTLIPEVPIPANVVFMNDELKRLAPQHPEWKTDANIQAILNGNLAAAFNSPAAVNTLAEFSGVTLTGTTIKDFNNRVANWMAHSNHPRFNRPYNQLVYQPMLEVIKYLQNNGFKNFIVSGSFQDFLRAGFSTVFQIPSEKIIGTYWRLEYASTSGQPEIYIENKLELFVDKSNKPIAIQRFIGKKPIICFGNSDADMAMLDWTTLDHRPSLGFLVHHTDAVREYTYDKNPSSSGKLDLGLTKAPQRGWVLIDMKADWRSIFPD